MVFEYLYSSYMNVIFEQRIIIMYKVTNIVNVPNKNIMMKIFYIMNANSRK